MQPFIVILIASLAVIFLARRIYQSLTGRNRGGKCADCNAEAKNKTTH
ncbi:MAG: hypothetical protein NT126_11805 [Bacteroidetes bacterium]|nr:hypothetical protein [Bacteroidota bacterium]